MNQAYERPRTPTRSHKSGMDISPYKGGQKNDRYANPSMLSHDVFYDKHYDDPNKQLTPHRNPLHIPPVGYDHIKGDYKNRYEHIKNTATPTRPHDSGKGYNNQGGNQNGGRHGDREHEKSATSSQMGQARNANRFGGNIEYPVDSHGQNRRQDQVDYGRSNPKEANTPSRQSRQSDRDAQNYRQGHNDRYAPHETRSQHSAHSGQRSQYSGNDRYQPDRISQHSEQNPKSTSTLAGVDLICDLCINKKMIDEKKGRNAREKDLDREYQENLLRNDQSEKNREAEDAERRKERFKQEAIAHWEESKRQKERQKEDEKRNDEAIRGLFHDRDLTEQQMRDLAEQRKNQLRNDLKNQIREKKMMKQHSEDESNGLPANGLQIGNEYVNRYDRYKDAHQNALKEQIDEKNRKKQEEQEADKRLQAEYANDMKNYLYKEQERRQAADQARKEHFRNEMENLKRQKEDQRRREEEDRVRELDIAQLNNERQREEEIRRGMAMKNRESAHLNALRHQIDDASKKKKEEEHERKMAGVPAFKNEQTCKLYDCVDCHNKYPKARLNKLESVVRTRQADLDY